MFEQKPNTGSLFIAEKKSEKHPDFTGTFKTDNEEYFISAWRKQGKKGEFLSLSVKKKEQNQVQNQVQKDKLPF